LKQFSTLEDCNALQLRCHNAGAMYQSLTSK
jgi:hypothetical protein